VEPQSAQSAQRGLRIAGVLSRRWGDIEGLPCPRRGRAVPFTAKKGVPHVASPAWHPPPLAGYPSRDHGQDAHATAGDYGVLLMLLSATLRLCVTLLFPFSLPRLGRVSAGDWGHTSCCPPTATSSPRSVKLPRPNQTQEAIAADWLTPLYGQCHVSLSTIIPNRYILLPIFSRSRLPEVLAQQLLVDAFHVNGRSCAARRRSPF